MFEQTFKKIDDVLWKEAGYATKLDYAEQTSWILFLKYLDDLEGWLPCPADRVTVFPDWRSPPLRNWQFLNSCGQVS